MDSAASLTGGGEARVQLLYVLGAASTPSVGGAASHTTDPGERNSWRPLIGGSLQNHSRTLVRGALGVIPRASLSVLC